MKTVVEKVNKQNQSKAIANVVAQQRSNGQGILEFADNRSEAIRHMRLRDVVESSSQAVNLKSSNKILQRATVERVQGNIHPTALAEITAIMEAVGEGNATEGREAALGALVRVAPQPGSQQTYSLGEDTEGQRVAIGSEAFRVAVGAGKRVSRGLYHAEMRAVREGCNAAIYATQDCCIFCYGYLARNNIAHQALREDPWPTTMWRHPNNFFTLASGYAAIGNLIIITHNGTSRYWQVYT